MDGILNVYAFANKGVTILSSTCFPHPSALETLDQFKRVSGDRSVEKSDAALAALRDCRDRHLIRRLW